MSDIEVRKAQEQDLSALYDLYQKSGKHDPGYFEICLEKQADGSMDVFIAAFEKRDAGFCLLNRSPKYGLYQKLGIPEIQDLNVIPEVRRQGVATALVQYCEKSVKESSDAIGVSVGLTSAYGAAQIFYSKAGYIPDGQGVTYDRQGVCHGALHPVDDDLCLMMIKTF